MQGLSNSAAFWILLMVVLAVLFFVPTLIGLLRGVDGLALVFLVNLIGAPALIGWPAALILACGLPRRPGVVAARQGRRRSARGTAQAGTPRDMFDWRRPVP
jgi:hypothetical protein